VYFISCIHTEIGAIAFSRAILVVHVRCLYLSSLDSVIHINHFVSLKTQSLVHSPHRNNCIAAPKGVSLDSDTYIYVKYFYSYLTTTSAIC
jgi:hypothetical protein